MRVCKRRPRRSGPRRRLAPAQSGRHGAPLTPSHPPRFRGRRQPRRRGRRAARPRARDAAPSRRRRRPASSSSGRETVARPPGAHLEPRRSDAIVHGPQRTRGTGCSSETGRTREPRGRRRPDRPASCRRSTRAARASVRSSVAAGGRLGERASRFSRARGSSSSQQRKDLRADQAALRVRVRAVARGTSSPSRPAVRLGLLAPEAEQRPDDAVLAPRLDPRRRDRSRRGGRARSRPGRTPYGRSRAADRPRTSSAARAARPRFAPAGLDDLGAEEIAAEARVLVGLGAAQAVVRRAARRRGSRAHGARARGRSNPPRRRRGRSLAAGRDQLVLAEYPHSTELPDKHRGPFGKPPCQAQSGTKCQKSDAAVGIVRRMPIVS